jgi:hypothetical protein
MNRFYCALALALALPLTACSSRHFVPATPPGFVDMGDENYADGEYRAATADGVVLGIRNIDNEPKGELAFWARALENRMRETGGYALLDKRSVTNRSGLTGTQLRFGHDEGKTPHLYWVTLFVTDKRIFILEAGGTKAEVEKQAPQIEWSFRNFLPK